MKLHVPSVLLGGILVTGLSLLTAFRVPQEQDVACLCFTAADKAKLDLLSIEYIDDCVSGPGYKTLRLTGANFQVVNGLNNTETTNGLGNVIVGYNENLGTCDRSGSHNIIDGYGNDYTSYGSIITGIVNASNSEHSAIIGGDHNINYAGYSMMGGGTYNTSASTAYGSSMIGGADGTIRSARGVIAGGSGNETGTSTEATCFGGDHGYATGLRSTTIGGGNSATFPCNQATGAHSVAIGGQLNTASGNCSTASGGLSNVSSANNSVVSGGNTNTASGSQATVSGGSTRTASGTDDWVAGSLFENN